MIVKDKIDRKMRSDILKGLAFVFLFLNICDNTKGQDALTFQQISTKDGLSQNTVRSIISDQNGFIWAGTLDGLVRYDGTRFLTYKPGLGELNQISDPRIRNINEDKYGYLWIKKYDNSYSCYDPRKEQFLSFSFEDNIIPLAYTNYCETPSGVVWLWSDERGAICVKRNTNGIPEISQMISDTSDSSSFLNIRFIFEDAKGNTWFGSENSITRLDIDGNFKSFYNDRKLSPFRNYFESKKNIYFLTEKNLIFVYNKENAKFEQSLEAQGDYSFIDVASLDKDHLLITTKQNLVLKINVKTGDVSNDIAPFRNDFISAPRFIKDKQDGIWLYDKSGKVQYFNSESLKYAELELIKPKIAKIIDDARYNVLIDAKGRYWITTYGNGLFTYNPNTNSLNSYVYKKGLNSPASDYLLSIAEDKVGNIWIGSEYAGIIKVTQHKYRYSYVKPEESEFIGASNNVKVVYKDSDDQLWLGTKNGGLYVYDKDLKFRKSVKKGMNPYTIMEDDKGRLWIGSKGEGVYVLNRNTYKEIYHFTKQGRGSSSLASNAVFDIIQDKKGRIWIATFGGGLELVVENTQGVKFRKFFNDKGNVSFIRCLLQDSEGKIWVGSYGGLVSFNPDELLKNDNAYTLYAYNPGHPKGLNSSDVKTIYEDCENQLWVGTAGGGLNKLVKDSPDQQGEFVKYTVKEGLPSSIITSILESKDGVLWVSTENGLCHLDKTEDTFLTYRFSSDTYGNYYSENAGLVEQDGTMLWGTLDGLLVFNPEHIATNDFVPPVVLTDLYLLDQRIETYKENSPLKHSISVVNKVVLDYDQRTFKIGFACLDLTDATQNKYSYMMEHYDEFWSQPGSDSYATYKNMPPGTYTFKVKGANADGQWSDQITTCTFVIKPPFWKTTSAYIGYFIILTGLMYVFIVFFIRINKLNSAVRMEKQLTDYKLRFFTNISHEFRTPLTLIKGAIESLTDQQDLPEEAVKNVKLLQRNTSQMSRLIEQLLEFRKLQNNVLTLNLENTDINEFTREAYYVFKEIALQKNIDYKFVAVADKWEFYIDRNKVEKILFNLLSNAFKYTPANGKITCSISKDEETGNCVIAVKDTGIGIPKDKQDLLFSRFMQINFSSEGTGVGLVLVKEFIESHKGTVTYQPNPEGGCVFTVTLPTDKNVYKDARFVDTERESEIEDEKIEPKEDANVKRPIKPHNWKVLVIDDNYDIRQYLSDELRHHCQVEVAKDGKEGLEKAVEINPTLIICDVKMPEMDGLELTKRLKDNFETSHIPIVLLTAMSSDTMRLQGSESGADAYIMKPFSMKYLLSRVYHLIEQREMLKKRFSVDVEVKKGALSEAKKDQNFYDLINKIVDDNLNNPAFTVADFTEKANLSRTIFYKKVKGLTGYSPNELIKVKRMKKAAELLLEGKHNVSEVSWMVGIEDPFYFSKCFKAQFGCAPSKYGTGSMKQL